MMFYSFCYYYYYINIIMVILLSLLFSIIKKTCNPPLGPVCPHSRHSRQRPHRNHMSQCHSSPSAATTALKKKKLKSQRPEDIDFIKSQCCGLFMISCRVPRAGYTLLHTTSESQRPSGFTTQIHCKRVQLRCHELASIEELFVLLK